LPTVFIFFGHGSLFPFTSIAKYLTGMVVDASKRIKTACMDAADELFVSGMLTDKGLILQQVNTDYDKRQSHLSPF
jgi:Icc-related predicted phosphoesterase